MYYQKILSGLRCEHVTWKSWFRIFISANVSTISVNFVYQNEEPSYNKSQAIPLTVPIAKPPLDWPYWSHAST